MKVRLYILKDKGTLNEKRVPEDVEVPVLPITEPWTLPDGRRFTNVAKLGEPPDGYAALYAVEPLVE